MSDPIISLIVARSENGVIGRNGELPWRMKSDLQWFKKVTTGKPVVMGRKTFESIGKPLPDRTNIVVTRQGDYHAEGALVVHGLSRALRIAEIDAQKSGENEVFVIGGGEIYAEALPKAQRIYRTTVETEAEGDAVFPELDDEEWAIRIAARIDEDEGNDHPGRIEILERIEQSD
jgi:dihydrofolate reductase